MEEKKNRYQKIIGIFAFILAFLAGKYFGFLVFIFLIAVFLGLWFPKWYLKRDRAFPSIIGIIAWSNLITWLLPPLGILTGCASLQFSYLLPTKYKRYLILGVIGLILSIANAALGIYMEVNGIKF